MWKFEFFPIFSNFLYAVQQLMRQLVYTMFIISNHAFFLLSWKENFVGHQKVSKYYDHDCQKNFLLLFMFLRIESILKKVVLWLEFTLYFKENVLDQTRKSFNTKFEPQWKGSRSSYQVRQDLPLFWNLVALRLG